jgi:LPS export ABC transporter protein LptC
MVIAFAKKHAGILAGATLIGLMVASFVALKDYQPFGRSEQPAGMPNIGLRLEDADMVGRQGGSKAWRFGARRIEVSQGRDSATFSDIRNGVVYNNGTPAITLTARKLVYNSFTQDIRATGGIQVVSGNNLSIKTSNLVWDAYHQRLTCPSHVTIETGGGKGSAASLTADLKNDQLELRSVNINIPVDEELF